jgi:hypothetical protein
MDEVNKPEVKTLLDGDPNARPDAAPSIVATRPGTCTEHGEYIDQQIPIRSHVGLKPFAMPYWLGCPECRRLAEAANKLEAKRWANLIPGEPSWSLRRR